MKKLTYILGGFVGIILIVLFLLPIFLKNNIVDILKSQSARYIDAELNLQEVNLSMFKDFPDLQVRIKNLVITGKEEFKGDTVVVVPLFEASVNFLSLFKGEEILIHRLLLKDGKILPVRSISGKNNWDIFIKDTTSSKPAVKEPTTDQSERGIRFDDISLTNLYFSYKDYQSSTYAGIDNIDLNLSGNFAEVNTLLQIALRLNNISYRQGNNIWINNTDLEWGAEIAANFQEQKFDIRKNNLSLNDLKLDLTGKIQRLQEKYRLNLSLNAPDTKFENLLALVPKPFQKKIEGLKTSGDFTLNVKAEGDYYKNHLPAFDLVFKVNEASIQYPELPESIRHINLALQLNNPGGSPDSTKIDLSRLSFTIAGNPFDMQLQIVHPNDPLLHGSARGIIDFSTLNKALPLEDIKLKGTVTTDILFNGKYQYIEKEQYEKFTAKGNILLKDLFVENETFPQGISIPRGKITVTPAYLQLNDLQAKVNSSDFTLQGKVSDYFPYFFKEGTLKGTFDLSSQSVNLNEFLKRTSVSTNVPDTLHSGNAAEGALEIPRHIDLQLTTRIQNLLFDRLHIEHIEGKVRLSQAIASLQNLRMKLLDGSMTVNGNYNTTDPRIPLFDFHLNIANFDIHAAYQSFTFIRKSIPIAMNCNGRVSADFQFSANLDPSMNLLMNTANGQGYIESQGILINENPAMEKLASALKNDELSRISIQALKIYFRIDRGNITVEPFHTNLAGNPATIYGSQTVDGNIDYTLSLNVNRKFFGKDIDRLLSSIPGSDNIKNLDVDVRITGSLNKPEVKADLSKAIKSVQKQAEKELKNKALKGLKGLFK